MTIEKIEESKDTLNFLEDIRKSLEGEKDSRIVNVKDTIDEIASENEIDLTGNLSLEEFCTLWKEYSYRVSDPTLNMGELAIKESPIIFFIIALVTYYNPEIAYKMLEDHEFLIKLGISAGLGQLLLNFFKKK